MTLLSNYSGMTRTTVQLRLKSGLLMTNQIREFWYGCDHKKNTLKKEILYADIQQKAVYCVKKIFVHWAC